MRLDPSTSDLHLPLKLSLSTVPLAQICHSSSSTACPSYFDSFIHSLSTSIFPFMHCSFICSLSDAWDIPAVHLRPSTNIALSYSLTFLILLFPELVNHFLFSYSIYGSPFTLYQKTHILFKNSSHLYPDYGISEARDVIIIISISIAQQNLGIW